jgi:hypothetical protein
MAILLVIAVMELREMAVVGGRHHRRTARAGRRARRASHRAVVVGARLF